MLNPRLSNSLTSCFWSFRVEERLAWHLKCAPSSLEARSGAAAFARERVSREKYGTATPL